MAWWQKKIVALLHDPPDKVLDIPTHRERADALMQAALRGLPDVPPTGVPDAAWIDAANIADTVASAADRLNFPKEIRAPSDCVLHPLSGQKMHLLSADQQKSSEAQADVIGNLCRRTNDPQKRFLLLWRCLEDELIKSEPNVPWSLLPADTRIPDHPLLQHARVASAFANCLPNPATLLFTIGPVQSFIAAARKTRDLWMGSFLLSYLTWHAIKVIAEQLGPDHVLFPSLLGQPLVDFWLQHEKSMSVEKPSPDRLRLATLPNRFFAVVPAEQAEELARQAEKAVREEWQRLAETVWQEICQKVHEFSKARTIWDRQLAQFPEVYWAIYKWDDTPEKIAELFQQLTGSERFVKWLEDTQGAYAHNQGSVYAACYDLTERALGARKALRNFTDRSEPAGKCSLCGERQALSDLGEQVTPNWQKQEKEFWRKVAEKFIGDVDSDGSERLCAICTVKRFAAKFVFADELKILPEFPSTDSIAAATFVMALFKQWAKAQKPVKDLLDTISRQTEWHRVAFVGMGIQRLGQKAEELDAIGQEFIAQKLTKLDGEWLFAESYDPERIKRAHGIEVSEEVARWLREEVLRKLYDEIARPNNYYAVLFMDGDQMGRWLSGTHEGLPKFVEILHPQVRGQLEKQSNWQTVLETQRLMSPSLHAAISSALANFALNAVPYVVEEIHAGRLVYAGGDDVLALLPLSDALHVARKLRALFSGEAKRQSDGDIFVEFISKQWTGWLEWNGRQLLTMGNRATSSIGIVIAHRLHPLRDVLRQGREAEEDAKELYRRNAICVRWLKRSGEQVQMGAKFFYPDHCIKDTLQLLLDFADLMRAKISRGFATDLMRESFALADLDEKAQEAELRRLLKRRRKSEASLSEEQIKDWAQKLARLAVALDTHADHSADPFDLTRPQRGIVELGKWLTFLRFLTGGGD